MRTIEDLKATDNFKHELKMLENDFESSQTPSWLEPATLKTLCHIVDGLLRGECALNECEDWISNRFGCGDFGKGCGRFVTYNMYYQEYLGNTNG